MVGRTHEGAKFFSAKVESRFVMSLATSCGQQFFLIYMYIIMLSFKMLATNIHAASSSGVCCAIV